MSGTKEIDYIILGAGITGLSMALALRDHDYAIFEKDSSAGGMCKTVEYDGFLFDYAEHFMRLDDNEVKNIVSNLLKENLESHLLNSAIYLDGRYIDYPFQMNLYGLQPGVRKECLIGYIEAYCSKKKSPGNFEEWIYRSFGKGIAKYFMIPYNEKIWTVHPREMTVDWFFNEKIVPTGNLERVIEGALERKNNLEAVRWYPRTGGIGSLSESFIPYIKNLQLNKNASKITLSEKIIDFEDGDCLKYNTLINTIPLPEFIKIIVDAPDDIKKASAMLKFSSVLCVNIGIDRTRISDRHWIYFPENEYIFSRVYFPANFSLKMVPEGKSSVSAIITYSDSKPLKEANIKKRVINDLIRAKILNETDKIVVCETLDIKYGFNIYNNKRKHNVEKILSFLEKNNIYSIGRYGRWEYSGIEHSIMESNDLMNRIDNREHQ